MLGLFGKKKEPETLLKKEKDRYGGSGFDPTGLERAAKAALLDWERDYLGRSSDSAIAPSPTKAAISRSNSLQKPPRLPAVAQPDLPRPPPKADFGHFQAAGP